MDGRESLKKGTILDFPGMRCTVQEEIGRGSNALVYRGWYEDTLTPGGRHHILIKELFPLHPRGLIRRSAEGGVCVEAEASELWELHLRSFERGNAAHLSLLEGSPGAVGGNINTFPLNGTHYTVLDYTGGRSLDQAIAAGNAVPLRLTALRILKLLDALRCFHEKQLVHLDVSPDNALLIGQDEHERVMLIDYNSVHTLEELRAGQGAYHSVKPGYTAPEVHLPTGRPVGTAADLFSVTAVFFACMTGRALTPFELTRREAPDVSGCECLRDAPDPVLRMVRAILKRGLSSIPEKRYQTIAHMRTDLRELIDRIDGVGITHWALWEAGRQQVASLIRANPAMAYIHQEEQLWPARVHQPDGGVLPLDEAVEQLLSPTGQSALLLGHGGIGKTTALLHTACRFGKRYSPAQSAVMYISLYGWTPGDAHYVTDHMLEYLRFRTDSQRLSDARHALRALMEEPLHTRAGDRPAVLLLIDGLNETPQDNEPLLRELRELSALPGVRLLCASRTESAGLSLPACTLSPLTDRDVACALSAAALALPESPEMQRLLRTPLMLRIFLSAARDSGRQLKLEDADGLMSAYFSALQEKEERDQPDNAQRRWQTAAALELVLPAVAAECARRQRALTAAELLDAVARCRRLLSPRWLRRLFPAWVGHSQEILGGTKTAEEWLGLMVQQLLWQHLGLLLQDGQNAFRPSHQELAEYLERQHAQRQRIVRRQQLCSRLMSGLAAAAMTALLVLGMRQILPGTPRPAPAYEERRAQSVYELAESSYLTGEDLVQLMLATLEGEDPQAPGRLRQLLDSAPDPTAAFITLGRMTQPDLAWDQPDDAALLQMGADFAREALDGRHNGTGYVIPWSQEAFDVQACAELMQFPAAVAPSYRMYLAMLQYASTDPIALSNGYYERILTVITDIVRADATYLVGVYHLACDPHLQEDYADFRAYAAGDDVYRNYDLYRACLPGLTDDEALFAIELDEARNARAAASLKADYVVVMAGYEAWQDSAAPQEEAVMLTEEDVARELPDIARELAAMEPFLPGQDATWQPLPTDDADLLTLYALPQTGT